MQTPIVLVYVCLFLFSVQSIFFSFSLFISNLASLRSISTRIPWFSGNQMAPLLPPSSSPPWCQTTRHTWSCETVRVCYRLRGFGCSRRGSVCSSSLCLLSTPMVQMPQRGVKGHQVKHGCQSHNWRRLV